MHRIFNKDSILTVPNLLSIIRILMIPFIIWSYCTLKQNILATVLFVISGLTDVVDGFIARKFNMISDFGKLIDPVADKLTQIALAICIATKYPLAWIIVGIFVVKETILTYLGYQTLTKLNLVNSAKWYGKLNTFIFFTTTIVLFIFDNISRPIANIFITASILSIVLAFVMYGQFFIGLLKGKNNK